MKTRPKGSGKQVYAVMKEAEDKTEKRRDRVKIRKKITDTHSRHSINMC